jgi:hypothetical protein
MKNLLQTLIFLFLTVHTLSAQIHSPIPNLTGYRAEYIRTLAGNISHSEIYRTTISTDDQLSDTLRITHVDNIWGDTILADLWLDGRKSWLKVHSISSINFQDALGFGVFCDKNLPLDEYFLLYDFEVLDTISDGETVVFETPQDDISIHINSIDTIDVFGVEKRRYKINYFDEEDYLIEGIGGVYAFSPLVSRIYINAHNCPSRLDITYMNATDTVMVSDTMIFGEDVNFCIGYTSVKEYEKTPKFTLYPNPVNGNSFTIESEENIPIDQVVLYDTQGKAYNVSYTPSNSGISCTVNTQSLSSGLYIVAIKSGTNYSRRKIVVE